jgi:5-methylcytosine-specific restriction endonuclease McrA
MSATLLLNADGNPVSMLPLSTLSWKESVIYMVLDKATVLEWHEDWVVHSANWQTRVPSVMILKTFEKKKSYARYSKKNVFIRDNYLCQYCGIKVTDKTATLDHVLPISHGGRSTYENTVCACAGCNARKGNNHRIRPKKAPAKPSYFQLVEHRKRLPFDNVHHSWLSYLGLEP